MFSVVSFWWGFCISMHDKRKQKSMKLYLMPQNSYFNLLKYCLPHRTLLYFSKWAICETILLIKLLLHKEGCLYKVGKTIEEFVKKNIWKHATIINGCALQPTSAISKASFTHCDYNKMIVQERKGFVTRRIPANKNCQDFVIENLGF